jgi:hypothetical protein
MQYGRINVAERLDKQKKTKIILSAKRLRELKSIANEQRKGIPKSQCAVHVAGARQAHRPD